ncbi:MAG: hypothetical protein ACMXYC_05085 [Candidatus Woesearchaeota archaeon]
MVQKRSNIELDIITLLLKEKNHVRGIAKTLHESHTTVLRKLNSLTKDNVIDCRKEGRNKIFYLKKNIVSKTYVFQAELHKRITLLRHNPELISLLKKFYIKQMKN